MASLFGNESSTPSTSLYEVELMDVDISEMPEDVMMKTTLLISGRASRKEGITQMYKHFVRDNVVTAEFPKYRYRGENHVVMVDFLNYFYDQRMGNSVDIKVVRIRKVIEEVIQELKNNHIRVDKPVLVIDWGVNTVKGTRSFDGDVLICASRILASLGLSQTVAERPGDFDVARHTVVFTCGYDGEDLMVYLTKNIHSVYMSNDGDALVIHCLLDDRKKLFYRNGQFQVVKGRSHISHQLHSCIQYNTENCSQVLRCSNISSH